MDMLTGPLCRDHAIGDLESILSAGVRGQEGDEGDQPGGTRTEFAARELSMKGRVRPYDPLTRLEFETNFSLDSSLHPPLLPGRTGREDFAGWLPRTAVLTLQVAF